MHKLYPDYVRSAEETADMLGGTKLVFEAVGPEDGTFGLYDPNDNSVHVVLPEARRVSSISALMNSISFSISLYLSDVSGMLTMRRRAT